ncbi:MAG: hypothetical protein ACI4BA_02910 [Prevotella sp.]
MDAYEPGEHGQQERRFFDLRSLIIEDNIANLMDDDSMGYTLVTLAVGVLAFKIFRGWIA